MSRNPAHSLRVLRPSGATPVCAHVEIADTFLARLIGLLGRKQLSPDSGLWLCPSSGVHTFGMTFPIDIVALDKDLRVVSLHRCMRPWKIAAIGKGVRSILELPSGRIDAAALALGDRLEIAPPA